MNNKQFAAFFAGITVISFGFFLASLVLQIWFEQSNVIITISSFVWFIIGRVSQIYCERKSNEPPSEK